ncbi:MAG: hypothetical protein KDA87_25675 [Planctomycetales bacterium]|nr:hypothetical protein [Planctomycetales bacterium]
MIKISRERLSRKRRWITIAIPTIVAVLTMSCGTASAQIAPDVSRYDLSDYRGMIQLSGHTDYYWYMAIYPSSNGQGNVVLWVNGHPITGRYANFGSYRWVQLDLYGAAFLYQVDLSQLNSRGPAVNILYFTDVYGNCITPGRNVLWEAI